MAWKGGIVQLTNGHRVGEQPTNLRDFLLEAPRGAYTTALVNDGFSIVDWALHLVRLVKSIAALHASIPHYFDAYYRWLSAENVGSLYQHILITLRTV